MNFLTFVRILLGNNQVKHNQRHSLMKDFLRDEIKFEESPSKPQDKDP